MVGSRLATALRLAVTTCVFLGLCGPQAARGGIIGIKDTRLEAYFAANSGATLLSDPPGLAFAFNPFYCRAPLSFGGPVDIPRNGNPIPAPFVRLPRTDAARVVDGNGRVTATGIAISASFIPNGPTANSAIIRVPLNSFLRSTNLAPVGRSFVQLNFSADYRLGGMGLAPGFDTAAFPVLGLVGRVPGSFAEIAFEVDFYDILPNGTLRARLGTLAADRFFLAPGAFGPVIVADRKLIGGIANNTDTLRLVGFFRFQGDPFDIQLEGIPGLPAGGFPQGGGVGGFEVPEPSTGLLFAAAWGGYLVVRRRARPTGARAPCRRDGVPRPTG
jgi:hypothetical protein